MELQSPTGYGGSERAASVSAYSMRRDTAVSVADNGARAMDAHDSKVPWDWIKLLSFGLSLITVVVVVALQFSDLKQRVSDLEDKVAALSGADSTQASLF